MTNTNYKTIASKIKFEGRAFINGKYVDAIDGEKFETINPATGEILCSVAKCNSKDVDLAVKVSRKAFNSGVWSRTSPEFRKDVLLKFAELLRKHGVENSVLECIDTGKLIGDCVNEVANDAPMHFQWYGELIDKVFGKVGPTEPSLTSLIVKEPIGIVAGVVPWNFPLMMAVWKMAPALAAGCSVIIKPAEDTPLFNAFLETFTARSTSFELHFATLHKVSPVAGLIVSNFSPSIASTYLPFMNALPSNFILDAIVL